MEITQTQLKALRGLLFWLREKRIALNFNNPITEIEETIKSVLNECDSKNISFRIQNIVLSADPHQDILDVIEDNKINIIKM